jgi:hypothetical protein
MVRIAQGGGFRHFEPEGPAASRRHPGFGQPRVSLAISPVIADVWRNRQT